MRDCDNVNDIDAALFKLSGLKKLVPWQLRSTYSSRIALTTEGAEPFNKGKGGSIPTPTKVNARDDTLNK